VWFLCCVLCLVVSCVCVSCQVCVGCGVLYLLLSINEMIRRSPACSRKKKENLLIAVLDCTHYFRCAVCLINQIMFSVERSYRRVVDNMIILLVLKFDSHKPDRLRVVLFTSPAPESVEFLNRFQKLQWLLKLMLK
jgi:hypothetical protein